MEDLLTASRVSWAAVVPSTLILILSPAMAWSAQSLPQDSANILWTLIAGVLVMFMQAGFAMVEAGFTRAKNAGNILMKNALDFSIGSIAFFLFGFALMFGADTSGLIGTSGFALLGIVPGTLNADWTLTFLFFQSVFAATAATIVSGGIAERTRFSGYLVVSLLVTALIYPVSGHWAWGGLWLGGAGAGWLENLGFTDFAGSTVVHSLGGWVALAGAWVLGPRTGKYSPDKTPRAIPGHNIPLGVLGVFILWFAWFGFNSESTTSVEGSIGYIALNTNLSAAAGVLGAMSLAWFRFGKPDVSISLNGALAGLVGITAGCFEVSPLGSIAIGLSSGILCVFSVEFIDKVLHIDDPVGAVSVHGVCGAFGTLAVGLFATPGFGSMTGLFYGGGLRPLGVQAIGVLAIMAWSLLTGYTVFKLAGRLVEIRATKDDELKGLDISEHGMEAYSGFQIFSNE